MLGTFFIVCIVFYLIGSIPTAFLVFKYKFKKNILKLGSGNVGAMNAYDQSGKKWIGIMVFVIDFLKGFLPVFYLTYIAGMPLWYVMMPAVLLVLGHCYSIFLKFKGGRGLATAAGVIIPINFWLMIAWCAGFLITIAIKRNVHIANVAATVVIPLAVLFLGDFLEPFTYDTRISTMGVMHKSELLFILSSSICLIILLKHVYPLIEIIKSKEVSNEQKSNV